MAKVFAPAGMSIKPVVTGSTADSPLQRNLVSMAKDGAEKTAKVLATGRKLSTAEAIYPHMINHDEGTNA